MKSKSISREQKTQSQSSEQRPAEQQVQQRAYELFLARGQEPGHELDDWVQAERELMHTGNGSTTRQSA